MLRPEVPHDAYTRAIGFRCMAQLLRAKVGDFDQDTATLRLWDGKGKRTQPREHLLPLAPHAAAMRANLAEDLGVDVDAISVKATTSEKLGFTGRGEGLAAMAVALLVRA